MSTLVKQFINHFGLDLKSNDIVRDSRFATGIKNAQYKKNGNIGKRSGYRAMALSAGGYGLTAYERINPTSGLTETEIITVDENLYKLNISTFTVDYSGSELSVVIEIFFDEDDNEFKCQIIEGVTMVVDEGLGTGFDEGVTVTLANLKATIDAVTNFSVTITGEDTVPAAFLGFLRNENIANENASTTTKYWTQINTPLNTPFSDFFAKRAEADFENMSFSQLNNVLFMTGMDTYLHKYDGQNVYRAGLPSGIQPTTAIGAAGSLTGTYRHRVRYTQIDAVGNIIDGPASAVSAPDLTPSSQSIDVTVTNVLANSGFNTNGAIVAGAQATTNTITVDDGSAGPHTLQMGDKAYFFDNIANEYITRNVIATTSTTITIDGVAVTVSDNAVISNDLRIGIYRNLNGGTTSFLVAEIPNNSFTATQVFNDNIEDNDLGIELIQPGLPISLPPKAKYVATYNNQLCLANTEEDKNAFIYTEPGQPEGFSPALRQLLIGREISGIRQDNEVMAVFEERVTHIISGDLANDNVRVDILNEDIGCFSHHSIQEVRGSLYFLSDKGIYRMTSGQQPQAISELIEPIFDIDPRLPTNERIRLKRAVAVNQRASEQYILFLPAETSRAPDVESNNFSRIFVQDYFRGAWLEWSNMNMAGGAIFTDNQLYFLERRFSTFESDVEHILYRQENRGDNWDFQDNTLPIDFEYDTAWYHFDEPSIFKKFLRLKVFGIEETDANIFDLDVTMERDFIQDLNVGSFVLDFASSGEGYGIVEYGTTPYGDVFDPNRKYKIGPIKAKALRFRMSNDNHRQNVDITGWEIELNDVYRRELKE